MNYQRIYDQLIERSKTRIPPEGYIEHHHIVPRCMNGSDDESNIAILTPEEHFVAHVLLLKIHPKHAGLIVAVSRMCKGKGRKRRRLYGWLRRRHSEYMKLNQSGKGNSQHGTMWVHKGIENKKIKKDEMIPEGWSKGRQFCGNSCCVICGADLGKVFGRPSKCELHNKRVIAKKRRNFLENVRGDKHLKRRYSKDRITNYQILSAIDKYDGDKNSAAASLGYKTPIGGCVLGRFNAQLVEWQTRGA